MAHSSVHHHTIQSQTMFKLIIHFRVNFHLRYRYASLISKESDPDGTGTNKYNLSLKPPNLFRKIAVKGGVAINSNMSFRSNKLGVWNNKENMTS